MTLREQIKAKLDEPCEDPRDQQVHDRLVRFDHLYFAEGHIKACAVQQVFNGGNCSCQKDSQCAESTP